MGCALLVVMVGAGGGGAVAAAVGGGGRRRPAHPAPTLGTVVIPNVALGYTVTSQGPLNASQFASDAPNPSAAARALSTLGKSISTYERVWQGDGGLNQVQDLLVRFPNGVGAQVFLLAAQHSLETGEIVSSDPVPSIPGARRVTYFAATNQDGVGEAITMRAGVYVDLLSIFSAASGNAHPISPADAERLAEAQYAAMARAPGGATDHRHRRQQRTRRPAPRRASRPAPSSWPWSSSPSWRRPWPPRDCLKRRRLAQEAAATDLVAARRRCPVSRRRG